MTVAEKRRFQDLERRIRELEARPPIVVNVPPIYVQPTAPQPWYPPLNPWYMQPCIPWFGQTVCDSIPNLGGAPTYPDFSSMPPAIFGLTS